MHAHYLTIKRQVDFLRRKVVGRSIVASFTFRRNEWVVVIEDDAGEKSALQFSADSQYPHVVWLEKPPAARRQVSVMNSVIGKVLADVEILPDDRVVRFSFRDSPLLLTARFFGAKTNFLLLDSDGGLQESFKRGSFRRGEAHLFPPEGVNGGKGGASGWEGFTSRPAQSLRGFLKTLPRVNQLIATELLHRVGMSGEEQCAGLASPQLRVLQEELNRFWKACGHDAPRIYQQDGRLVFALTELRHLRGVAEEQFQDINSALRQFCFAAASGREMQRQRSRISSVLQRKHSSLQQALEKLRDYRPDPQKQEYYQNIGQLLISQPHLLKSGSRTVELVNYFNPDLTPIAVTVDPALSAAENAENYFRKARSYGIRQAETVQRRRQLQEELKVLAGLLQKLEKAASGRELSAIEEELKSRQLLPHSREENSQYRLPYKKFDHQGWEIWVGRSARDNDQMTFRLAHKEDIWMHVQGYSGSHVIVRGSGAAAPPGPVLNYAARLAVTNSSARHARYVPVIYTRVKYLRKPRKSPAGTVIPSREKTLFVDPLD